MISRRQKELTGGDIRSIADTYHNWKGTEWQEKYKDIPGFCKAANIQEIRENNYILTPGRYIELKGAEEDEQAFDEKMIELTENLKAQMEKSRMLDEQIKISLKKVGYEL